MCLAESCDNLSRSSACSRESANETAISAFKPFAKRLRTLGIRLAHHSGQHLVDALEAAYPPGTSRKHLCARMCILIPGL